MDAFNELMLRRQAGAVLEVLQRVPGGIMSVVEAVSVLARTEQALNFYCGFTDLERDGNADQLTAWLVGEGIAEDAGQGNVRLTEVGRHTSSELPLPPEFLAELDFA